MIRAKVAIVVAMIAAAVLAGACGDSAAEPVIDVGDPADYAPVIEPAEFTSTVDNPYWPLAPGTRWVYEAEADGEVSASRWW